MDLPLCSEDRIVQVLSWHQVQTDEEAAGLIPEEKVRLCMLVDSARWIWKQAQALFPSAVEVLDYYHGSERLHR